jgi:hypothetical protein
MKAEATQRWLDTELSGIRGDRAAPAEADAKRGHLPGVAEAKLNASGVVVEQRARRSSS